MILCFLLLALSATGRAQTGNEPRNLKQLYTPQGLETIRHPDHVFIVLLKDRLGKISERSRKIPLTVETQQQATQLLLANASYGWGGWSPCAPEYGVRLIFEQGAKPATKRVTIDYCFDCTILSVTPSVRPEDHVQFGPTRAQWLRLFQSQFPKDQTLQSVH